MTKHRNRRKRVKRYWSRPIYVGDFKSGRKKQPENVHTLSVRVPISEDALKSKYRESWEKS